MTKVINLFGGSGLGKSTTAALTFGEMKLQGFHVELIREYVKKWAWMGITPGKEDQLYLAGKQWHAESKLYHKLDYLVTDSPVLIAAFYEAYHTGNEYTLYSLQQHIAEAETDGVEYLNFFLKRNKNFDPRGRYETEEQARRIDDAMEKWLKKHNINYMYLDAPDRKRPHVIIDYIMRNCEDVQKNTTGNT